MQCFGAIIIKGGINYMKYRQEIILKNGKTAVLRNGTKTDATMALEVFHRTHDETDYLLSYSDEISIDVEGEARFLEGKTESQKEIEILAFVDGKVVGMAGIDAIGKYDKVKHRAEFGINILKDYWGLGIGKALLEACIKCAREIGYRQLELTVVSDNERAVTLYQKAGFAEYGRNPKGFLSRIDGYQETVFMCLEL